MIVLSYGFQLPQTGDKGPIFWPALEDDIQQLNDHNHNGTNSSKLVTSAVDTLTQLISAAGWVSLGGGNYRQLVTLPSRTRADQPGNQAQPDPHCSPQRAARNAHPPAGRTGAGRSHTQVVAFRPQSRTSLSIQRRSRPAMVTSQSVEASCLEPVAGNSTRAPRLGTGPFRQQLTRTCSSHATALQTQ